MDHPVFGLTQTEFSVLLNAIGADELYGMVFEDIKDITEVHVFNAMNMMVQKKILEPGDGAFIIDKEIKALLMVIKNAFVALSVSDKENTLPFKICYSDGKSVAVCEAKYVNKSELRLSVVSPDKFAEYLQDEGYVLRTGCNITVRRLKPLKEEDVLEFEGLGIDEISDMLTKHLTGKEEQV